MAVHTAGGSSPSITLSICWKQARRVLDPGLDSDSSLVELTPANGGLYGVVFALIKSVLEQHTVLVSCPKYFIAELFFFFITNEEVKGPHLRDRHARKLQIKLNGLAVFRFVTVTVELKAEGCSRH